MAAQFHEDSSAPTDPVEVEINQTIDRMIGLLGQRRMHLVSAYRDKREELRVEQGTGGTEEKAGFLCDTRELEVHISRLGNIQPFDLIPTPTVPSGPSVPPGPSVSPHTPAVPPTATVPDYAEFKKPIFSFGKKGAAPGEFSLPRGISIQEGRERIFVADMANHRIQIFSESGDLINHFGDPHLKLPMGVLVHKESLYVTDCGHHSLFKFTLPDLAMVKQVGKEGSGKDEFNSPGQIALSPNQLLLHIADEDNNRIQMLDCNMDFQDSFKHQTMTRPVDVKFSTNQMLVLSYRDNPCVHVFSLSGDKVRAVVTRGGAGMQVRGTCFFCLDARNNILISDCSTNNVKVFSYDGDLLHTIGKEGHEPGMFFLPYGIAILRNNKLFCVSQNRQCAIQIYS